MKIDKRRHLYCYYQHTCLNMYFKWIASCEPFAMIRKAWYSSVSICRRINNNTRTTNPNSAFSHQLQAVSTCIIGYKFSTEKIMQNLFELFSCYMKKQKFGYFSVFVMDIFKFYYPYFSRQKKFKICEKKIRTCLIIWLPIFSSWILMLIKYNIFCVNFTAKRQETKQLFHNLTQV